MRAALHVCDAVALQLRLELGAPAPSGVLAALIGQDLPRRPVVGDAARERLEHQHATLVMRHRKAHEVAGVIVQECRHVDPLVSAQQEREQIRLPQLVRLGTLEVLHLDLLSHSALGRLRLDPLGSQHPSHRRLRRADPQKPPHHIADATVPSARCLRTRCEDRLRALIGRLLQVRM